ncbi:UPF0496 protein 4-like [Lolium rigidum]|uniref:UPF0496 protein 4-like n=1 Tax=Lolium rigidum TaxID=89674 RepID=UPI001F5D6DCE|nr:UPF0496 protein 4-like [Lolium rigidum]
MFLTDKYHALLPIHSAKGHRKPAEPVSRFDTALAARLASLLPLPASPLAALARLTDLLAATLADAAPALSSASASADDAAVAAHLDAGVALLDACNAIAARVDRLRRRRLLSRLALHLLSSSPSSAQRARAALADHGGAPSPPVPLPSVPFANPPRGAGRQLTGAARVLLAVNAVSSLAATAAATILGSDSSNPNPASLTPLVLSSDLPWAEPFNALSTQLALLAAANTSEVDAVDEAVRKLASALDTTADEASVLAAAQEVEERTEELAALLDRLSDAVNAVFRAALRLRAAELGSFAVGPADKTRKK